jgi:hypothetical protein
VKETSRVEAFIFTRSMNCASRTCVVCVCVCVSHPLLQGHSQYGVAAAAGGVHESGGDGAVLKTHVHQGLWGWDA